MAEVAINPGRVGQARVTIRVMREDHSIFAAQDVRLILEPPAGSGKSRELAATQTQDGAWAIADVALASSGTWTIQVVVIARSGETIVLDAPIVIGP